MKTSGFSPTGKLSTRALLVAALLASATSAAKATITFTFDYSGNTPGVGFLDPVDGPAREAALATAGQMFSDLFSSHFSNSGSVTLSVTSSFDPNGNTLMSAGSDLAVAGPGFGNLEVVPQKLKSGVDLNGAAADGGVDVNWGHLWEINPTATTSSSSFDFYAAAFHEFTHTLGFSSVIFDAPTGATDALGNGGQGTGTQGSWSAWDKYLTALDGTRLINPATLEVNNAALATTLAGSYFDGPNAMAAYGGPVPLQTGGSNSHLNQDAFSPPINPTTTMMTPGRGTGPDEARTWAPVEIGILTDLGYTPVPEPSAVLLIAGAGLVGFIRRRRA